VGALSNRWGFLGRWIEGSTGGVDRAMEAVGCGKLTAEIGLGKPRRNFPPSIYCDIKAVNFGHKRASCGSTAMDNGVDCASSQRLCANGWLARSLIVRSTILCIEHRVYSCCVVLTPACSVPTSTESVFLLLVIFGDLGDTKNPYLVRSPVWLIHYGQVQQCRQLPSI
jgi:hypothetical protein